MKREKSILKAYIQKQQALGHRALIWITGLRIDCHRTLVQLLNSSNTSEVFCLMSHEAKALLEQTLEEFDSDQLWDIWHVTWSTSRALLGHTIGLLVIDLFDGMHPDALGATLGTVNGGGIILLLGPEEPPSQGSLREHLLVWPHPIDQISTYYWQRWWQSLQSHHVLRVDAHSILEEANVDQLFLEKTKKPYAQNQSTPILVESSSLASKGALQIALEACCTDEQRRVIERIWQAQVREAFTAVSVTAPRGRGKSYALGLAAGALLLNGEGEICLTAPREDALESLFEAAYLLLEQVHACPILKDGFLQSTRGVIKYVSPGVLWAREQPLRTLFVDEAASLPVPLLIRLLEGKPKLVFSTTTDGYEGAGRGFSLRFRPYLQRKVKKLYECSLSIPIRWSSGDPVEAWTHSSLLLDATIQMHKGKIDLRHCEYLRWTGAELIQNEGILKAIFGLLVSAHYRTQPSDAWRLLDAPNLSVHTLSDSHGIAAVALISEEGSLTPQMAAELFEGRSRPRGQLFAANFSVHLNCEEAALLKMARVVRIATRPQDQSQGLGSLLLQQIEAWAIQRGIELFGASFGVTDPLLKFWLKHDFKPLRVSVRQSHMSGERSALVCKGLTTKAQTLLERLEVELTRDFEAQLRGPLRLLELEVVCSFLSRCTSLPDPRLSLSRRDWLAVSASAFAGRAYELSERAAHALAVCAVSVDPRVGTLIGTLDDQAQSLGIETWEWRVYLSKALQGHRWLEITRAEQLDGPSVAMKAVSQAQRALLWRYAPTWVLEEARRFPRFKEKQDELLPKEQ